MWTIDQICLQRNIQMHHVFFSYPLISSLRHSPNPTNAAAPFAVSESPRTGAKTFPFWSIWSLHSCEGETNKIRRGEFGYVLLTFGDMETVQPASIAETVEPKHCAFSESDDASSEVYDSKPCPVMTSCQ